MPVVAGMLSVPVSAAVAARRSAGPSAPGRAAPVARAPLAHASFPLAWSAALQPRGARVTAVRAARVRAVRAVALPVVAVAAPPSPSATVQQGTGTPYSSLTLGFPKETHPEEKRTAATPDTVARLHKAGFGGVLVESGLGDAAGFSDAAYVAAGAVFPLGHCVGRGNQRPGRARGARNTWWRPVCWWCAQPNEGAGS